MHYRVCNPHSLQSSSSNEEPRKVTGIFRTPKSVLLATTLNTVFIMKQPKGDGTQEETEAKQHLSVPPFVSVHTLITVLWREHAWRVSSSTFILCSPSFLLPHQLHSDAFTSQANAEWHLSQEEHFAIKSPATDLVDQTHTEKKEKKFSSKVYSKHWKFLSIITWKQG